MSNKKSGAETMRRTEGAGRAFGRMMKNGSFNSTIVYIEGDSDIIFYKWLVDKKYVALEPMTGKEAAIGAVTNCTNKKGVLGLVDSDFDNILGIVTIDNVIRTDTHDIETLMLSEGMFRYSEESLASKIKMNSLGISFDIVRECILDIGCQIGKLRLISLENNLNLNFNEVEDQIEKDELIKVENNRITFNSRQYIYKCVKVSQHCQLSFKQVHDLYEMDNRTFDKWQICRGHDLTLIISIVYSMNIIGCSNINKKHVEMLIRPPYITSRKFKKTTMFQSIKKWQLNNLGYKVLSDELL